jgi:hypothetical protein
MRALQNKKNQRLCYVFSDLPLTFRKDLNTMEWEAQKPAQFASPSHYKEIKQAVAIKFTFRFGNFAGWLLNFN